MSTFVEEVAEHVRDFNRDLLALEAGQGDPAALLQSLFRTAHNMKGAARAVDATAIETACHAMEDILARARDGEKPVDAEAFRVLFASADVIQEAGARLKERAGGAAGPLPVPSVARMAITPDLPAPAVPLDRRDGDSDSLRVSADKLDAVLTRSGELLLAVRKNERHREEWTALADAGASLAADFRRLRALIPGDAPRDARAAVQHVGAGIDKMKDGLERAVAEAAAGGRTLMRTAGDLDAGVRSLRMVPFGEAAQGLERVVRDLARASGKEVAFSLLGQEVELDRAVAERLRDPLMHLVRNAVDHGIELPAERAAAGKPAGRITVSAALKGAQIEIAIADDGRGLDRARIREAARDRGLAVSAEDRDLLALVFHPGFSTARAVTAVSGRGVGLDVVKSQVNALHGTVAIESVQGAGTVFTLTVPLTVTLIRALLVECAGRTFAVATTQVMALRRLNPQEVRRVGGREMLATAAHGLLPLISMAEALGLPAPRRDRGKGGFVVLVEAGTTRVAFVVDGFLAEQDLVVTGLGRRLRRVPFVAGCAMLEDGGIALILSAAELAESALGAPAGQPLVAAVGPEAVRRRLLVADDSVTTRTLEKAILEEAGYEVRLAADGHQAWRILQKESIDLVVADVEMPGMDGFTLTETLRHSTVLPRIPVVLVTSLSSDKDRARGLEVGADAYIVKSGFDRSTLLAAVAQLL